MKRWRHIGHTPRKPGEDITKHVLKWNPQGERKREINWLITGIYCFLSHSRIFFLNGDVIIANKGLRNLGLCCLWAGRDLYRATPAATRGTSVFSVSSEGPSHSIASYDTQGCVEDLFLDESSRVPIQSPLTYVWGRWGPIATLSSRVTKRGRDYLWGGPSDETE
jgi:hypothetical protein